MKTKLDYPRNLLMELLHQLEENKISGIALKNPPDNYKNY